MRLFILLSALLFFTSVADNDAFVSLHLDQSSMQTPSRVFTTFISIGRPEKRYMVVVDFASNEIEMNLCMRDVSYTFNVAAIDNVTSDLILFDEDTLLDPVKRGIYRMPVREHCVSNADPPFAYLPCLMLPKCAGVIGIGPRSPLWIKWSAVTLTHNSLHLGQTNPLRQTEKPDKIICNVPDTSDEEERLCQFNATLAGRRVLVDFHSHDSFIYVPADIYRYYTEERNLYGFTNTQKRSALRLSHKRQTLLDALRANHSHEIHRQNATHAQFIERVRVERQLALQHSAYYRGTHEVTDLAAWPPLVLMPLSSSVVTGGSPTSNIVVLEYDLLVFSPLYSGTYGKRARSSAMMPFADYMDSTKTLLLRPFANATITDRVSLGNVFFRHYKVHRDHVRNTLEIAERFTCDNLSDVEVLGGLFLYLYFVFSVCRVMWYSVTLTMSLNRRCPICSEPMSPYRVHRLPPTFITALGVLADALLVGIVCWSLVHIESFLGAAETSELSENFLAWSWWLALPNILVVLLIMLASPGHAAPPDGTFCWRTFRWTVARAACSEQCALLGILWMSLILQTDSIGTLLSVLVAAIMFFSAAHHFIHLVLFESNFDTYLLWFVRRALPVSMQPSNIQFSAPIPHTGNFPDANANVVWFAFSLLILLMLNLVFSTFVMLRYIVWPTLDSVPMTVLVYAFALLSAVWLLDTYERETIRRTKFSSVDY